MKYTQITGVAASVFLMVSGFMNWAWYPDIQTYFTGFFSEDNIYGKPAKVLIFFAVLAIVFFLLNRVWAKRWNIFICAVTLGFGIKSFILFSACYRGICPIKQPGIWVMLACTSLMMVCALLPDMPGKGKI